MNAEHPIALWTAPALLIIATLVFEIAYTVARRKESRGAGWTIAAWALRPWALWAVFNLLFRFRWEQGFNNRRTFPFFANLWDERATPEAWLQRLATTPTVYLWLGVVLLVGLLIVLLARRILDPARPLNRVPLILTGLYALTLGLHLSVASLPDGAWSPEDQSGSLLSCWNAHATMLYTIPHIKSSKHYLRNFLDIQPNLRQTIHGLSHPPGASLSLYWLGKAAGAKRMNIRTDYARIRYALALTAFGALSLFVIYLLGRDLFGDRRIGLAAALLWMTAPSVTAYGTFAQDTLYAVFFNLALWLTWRIGTAERTPWKSMVALGGIFYCIVFLNYSWCLATSIFALFLAWSWATRRWSFREAALRGVIPLGLMTVLAAGVLLGYRLNYLEMYRVSSEFVALWYNFDSVYTHLTAWIGGQFDLWLLMGSVACSALFVSLARMRRDPLPRDPLVFLAVVLAIFSLPVLFGPTCLRMETARCWNWVAAVPFAFAARELLRRPRSPLFVVAAVAVSILTYTGMRLFINFAP